MKISLKGQDAQRLVILHRMFERAQEAIVQPFLLGPTSGKIDFREGRPANDRKALEETVLVLAKDLVVEQPAIIPLLMKIVSESRVWGRADWEENSYFRHISLPAMNLGRTVMLKHGKTEVNSVGQYKTFDFEGFTLLSVVLARDEIEYPVLMQHGRIWMSLTPMEIAMAEAAVKAVSGRVLTFGAGLGYFPFMASMKEEVSEVVVVEKDPVIASLFEEHILPQFPNRTKVKLFRDDAFKFLADVKDGDFNFIFADVWDSSADYAPWIQSVRICSKFKETRVMHWVEDLLLLNVKLWTCAQLYSAVFSKPMETALNEQHLDALFQDVEVASVEDVEALMNNDSLRFLVAHGGKEWTRRQKSLN